MWWWLTPCPNQMGWWLTPCPDQMGWWLTPCPDQMGWWCPYHFTPGKDLIPIVCVCVCVCVCVRKKEETKFYLFKALHFLTRGRKTKHSKLNGRKYRLNLVCSHFFMIFLLVLSMFIVMQSETDLPKTGSGISQAMCHKTQQY
jgi:hypothetical protein